MSVQVLQGDCIQVMKALKDNSVDAVCCDPPYALNFMGKEWDNFAGYVQRNGSSRAVGDDGGRHDEGYRNMRGRENEFQSWCQMWAAECLRILKPGGHLLAFGGTRTYHRMACGIEDAGFEIRDSLHWIYGSGFPKSLDVGKAIDKAAGAEREVIGPPPKARGRAGNSYSETRRVSYDYPAQPLTAPATDAARQWDGWGTALKPAHEPVVCARKLLIGTVAANVLEYGTGALNIDGCRVAHTSGENPSAARRASKAPEREAGSWANDRRSAETYAAERPGEASGRWPPNILLDEEMAAEMDRQTGILKSGSNNFISRSSADFEGNTGAAYGAESRKAGTEMVSYGDQGGASRFFPCFKYQAKAKPSERPKVDGINHPTIKPVALMQWLVRLITPPGGVVLDPFAGSGTTGEACLEEGFSAILIEREPDYIKLIKARLDKREPTLWD